MHASPASPPHSLYDSGKSLHFGKPQFPHLKNGGSNKAATVENSWEDLKAEMGQQRALHGVHMLHGQ